MSEVDAWTWFVWLVVVVVTIAVPAVIVGLGLRNARATREDPREVLRRRLARGEITQAQFEAADRALDA